MPELPTVPETDAALLRAFSSDHDEAAFAALVSRYAGLVYGVASRRAGPSLADEVTQNVFATLARKARSLDASRGLGGWLHKTAAREAANIARKEQRRNRAMERYAETLGDGEPAADSDLMPVLDDALIALGGSERQLIMLRFFESLSFREIGHRLGASEEAGRKRVSRALDKLAAVMHRRVGRTVPAVGLATFLGATLKTEAPAVVVASAATATGAAGSSLTALTIMKTSQLAFVATLVLTAAIPVAAQWRASAKAVERTAPKPSSGAKKSTLTTAEAPTNVLAAAAAAFRKDDKLDLNKLAAALARVDENGEPADLLLDLTAQMYALRETDIPAVGDLLLNAANAEHLRKLFDAYFSRWAEFDPRTALDATNSDRWKALAGNSRIEAAQTWAAADPDAAVEWCEAQQHDIFGSILKMCVFREWAIADPHAALARTADLPVDRRFSYRRELLSVWAHHDPEGAIVWALDVEDETERTRLVSCVIENRCQQNAASGFELAESLEDPILRTDGLRYAFMQWRFQPVESARGFLSLPEADRTEDLASEMLDWLHIEHPFSPEEPEAILRAWLSERERGEQ